MVVKSRVLVRGRKMNLRNVVGMRCWDLRCWVIRLLRNREMIKIVKS